MVILCINTFISILLKTFMIILIIIILIIMLVIIIATIIVIIEIVDTKHLVTIIKFLYRIIAI